MKPTLNQRTHFFARSLALAGAAMQLVTGVTFATPYATCLTNQAGLVSFRLNQTTGTNDTVMVISSGGTVTNYLQQPSADLANVIARGLIVTNLKIADGTFQVRIIHTGSGVISTNSPRVAFNSPRGVAVNNRPGSPYFGWVYVGNSAAGSKGDGMFAFSADLADIMGQGATAMNGGYNFGTGGASAPYHCSVAPDDSVLVTDWSDASGNLIAMPPMLDGYDYVLQPLTGSAATPVTSANNHGSVISAFMTGTGANRKLYTMDEDYQTDPDSSIVVEQNSAWVYNIGDAPYPWTNAPDRKLMTPYLSTFTGQNQKCEVYGHYLYANQRRSNPPQHDLYITDLDHLQDPSTFHGATPWDTIWTSQDESLAEGYSDDVLRDTMTFAVSPDQKWIAAVIAAGSANITAPDGSTFATAANDVVLIPLTNGIPNLPARQVYHFGGAGNGRDIAIDAAHNVYMVTSGLGILQSLDIGETTDATSGSDGTFNLATPATQVSIAATTPIAYEQGSTPGVITITRTGDDLGAALPVFYTITGTAANGTDYNALTNVAVIPAGQASVTIPITPIDDTIPEPTETVTLTVHGSGGYSVGFPLSATVYIADNETPELHITGLSSTVYEGNPNDYAAITLQRWGNTNVDVTLDASSFALGGTAVPNVDYYLTNLPYTLPAGQVSATFPLIYPLKASTQVGALSILVTNVAGSGYTVVSNTAATTLALQAAPPGTVLFSDDFESASSANNWQVAFQSYNNGSSDYNIVFGYDYTSGSINNLFAVPPAPHSTHGDTKGLFMTVNKNAGMSAGLNAYLKGHAFSGNYALRFDMFLVENSSGTAQSKVENALFGINHDGQHTNWFRNQVTGTSPPDSATASDGLFFDVGADGNGGGGAPYDFAAWSGPTWTNTVGVVGPTNFLSRLASTTREIFKRPPFDSGTALGGDPANTILNPTPTWVEVEVSQLQTALGPLITWKINNSVILSFYNTNAAAMNYTNGTVMLGYCDPWDDLGNGSAGSGEGCVIFDNVQVVQLSAPQILTQPANVAADVGGSATFSVVASTVTGVTNYQWFRNGTLIAGATDASLTLNPVKASDLTTYYVQVSDGAYTVTSDTATLAPASGPVITVPPASRAAVVGSSPTFSVTATTTTGVTNYQWQYYGTNIASGTTRVLTLSKVQPVSFGGPYTVIVSDGFNSVTSAPPATLTLAVTPSINGPIWIGNALSFTIPAEFGPAYVVEYKASLSDASWTSVSTNTSPGGILRITNTSASPQGYYRLRLQ